MIKFPQISLLITHYKRSKSLEHLLLSFKNLEVEFGEIIVSDDASPQEHLDYIEKELMPQYGFKLIKAERNGGLGNNINKGQDAVTKPFTLYVQEDFRALEKFPAELVNAISFFDADPALDIVRFYSYLKYPYLKPYNENYSLMYFSKLGLHYKKIYYYSDHPHLRRSSFLEKFGRYKEGVNVDRAEYAMCVSFIQNKGKGLFYNNYKELFNQVNTSSEPSTAIRNSWRQRDNFFVKSIRNIYRQVKYNCDIFFMRR